MTAVIHRTLVINAAFLQEIKEDNRELRDLLARCRKLLGPNHETPRNAEIMDLLEELCDQLGMHFALEEAFGYFEDAIYEAPQLSSAAESLRQEHAVLFCVFCGVTEIAERLRYRHASVRQRQELAEAFHCFDAAFCDHESREAALIVQAIQDEIGVGD